MQVAASVTPCRHNTGPTVLDERREPYARESATSLGGDVMGAHEIPVPLEPTVQAAEPAAVRLGNPPSAGGAGGRGSALVDQLHHDPGLLGLVAQRLQQMVTTPLPQPEVLDATCVLVRDPFGISDHQGADPLLDGESNHLLGGLMLSLMDATAVSRLGTPNPDSMTAPAP